MVADIMMKPLERQQISQRVSQNQSANRATPVASPGPPLSFNCLPPPHMKPGSNAFQQPPLNPEERRCFGCGGTGHTMFFCSKISDLVTKGIITKDNTGKYIMADGTFIRRTTFDEPLIAAVERLRPIQTHYISASSAKVEDYDSDSSDSSDSESEENVFVATRSSIKNSQPRKTTSEKVFNPARRKHEESHPRFGDKKKTEKKVQQEEIIPVPSTPVPVSIDDNIFNPQDDDAFMEDTSQTVKRKDLSVVTKRVPKQSEVQSQVDQRNVLSRILNQPVTLAIGEVFGISKEMTSNLREVLKPKPAAKLIANIPEVSKVNLSQANQPIVAAAMVYRAKETLIKLKMECEGIPITAIIDMGSQLNIAHKNVWKEVLSRPLDTQSTVNMNDANGGASKLKGLVPNVPLICGGVKTFASLYIGEKVPFDLLLGRPWQRGNFVSIDERADGTYLIFKDQDMNPRHEILVTPDEHLVEDPNIADFINRARNNRFTVNSFFISDEENEDIILNNTAHIEEMIEGGNLGPTESILEIQQIPQNGSLHPSVKQEIERLEDKAIVLTIQTVKESNNDIPSSSDWPMTEGLGANRVGQLWPNCKRQTTPPENPRPSIRIRMETLVKNRGELSIEAETVVNDEDLPPGLESPGTNQEVEKFNQLWSSSDGSITTVRSISSDTSSETTHIPSTPGGVMEAISEDGEPAKGQDRHFKELDVEEDEGTLASLGKVELVQVLTKSNTSTWRERFKWKGNEPQHQRAVMKSKRHSKPRRLLTKAVENTRMFRLWGLVKKLRESQDGVGPTDDTSKNASAIHADHQRRDNALTFEDTANETAKSQAKTDVLRGHQTKIDERNIYAATQNEDLHTDTSITSIPKDDKDSERIDGNALTVDNSRTKARVHRLDTDLGHEHREVKANVSATARNGELSVNRVNQNSKALPEKSKNKVQVQSKRDEQAVTGESSEDKEVVIAQIRQLLKELSLRNL